MTQNDSYRIVKGKFLPPVVIDCSSWDSQPVPIKSQEKIMEKVINSKQEMVDFYHHIISHRKYVWRVDDLARLQPYFYYYDHYFCGKGMFEREMNEEEKESHDFCKQCWQNYAKDRMNLANAIANIDDSQVANSLNIKFNGDTLEASENKFPVLVSLKFHQNSIDSNFIYLKDLNLVVKN